MSDLTKSQEEALERAWSILTEHFDRALLVVDSDVDNRDGRNTDDSSCLWHGGYMSAIGMAHYALNRITNS